MSIIYKLSMEDSNKVPCDDCGEDFIDDDGNDGISIEFPGSQIEIGLCSHCRKELINNLMKAPR